MKNTDLGFFGRTPGSQSTVDQTLASSIQAVDQQYDNLNRFFKNVDPNSPQYPQYKHNVDTLAGLVTAVHAAMQQSTPANVSADTTTPTPTRAA